MQAVQPVSDTASLAATSTYARSHRTTDDHDAMSLTTSNPFEEEQDYTSYQIVSRLMNKVKEAFVPSLGTASPAPPSTPALPSIPSGSSTMTNLADPRQVRSPSARPAPIMPNPAPPNPPRVTSPPLSHPSRAKSPTASMRAFPIIQANPLPPLVSLTPVTSSVETSNVLATAGPARIHTHGHSHHHLPQAMASPPSTTSLYPYPVEANMTSIPGFPLPDDARTVASVGTNGGGLRRTESVSKAIRRIRGEGLSKKYWMEDEHCKECYDCKSVFTTWRRKHHCRICGQIFCSRCASNLIKASRFNAEGSVRVCNLCMRMIEEENAHSDDDDRRSISSLTPSLPTFHNHSVLDVPYLTSIAERDGRGRKLSDGSRQPITPPDVVDPATNEIGLIGGMNGDGYYAGWEGWEPDGEPVAPPFRRGFDDADDYKNPELEKYISGVTSPSPRPDQPDTSPDLSHVPSGVDISTPPQSEGSETIPVPDFTNLNTMTGRSSVAFPTIGSAEGVAFPGSPPWSGGDSPRMGGMGRMATLSTASLVDPEMMNWPRSGMRSRVQSRLPDFEAGWRTRRESSAYAAELNAVSMQHLRIILRQELRRGNINDVGEWESTLVILGLKLSTTPFGNPRVGDSIDPRDWVKIKRIPGGAPKDSECIDGVMITKNVAHKNMSRSMKGPRVMLVTFPFEYQRVEGQFMPLEPLLAQEREYLANLVSRVAALRPHIVLVERSVSRIALEMLLARNIAVGRTVKPSAIAAVARATQADIISSIDRLALEPRLGHAGRFRVQTFEHELIPGRRKSYMRFEGCHREYGVTLAVRGGSLDVLTKIKAIAKLMVLTVRNLKMETFLWRDLLLSMPQLSPEASLLPVALTRLKEDGDTGPESNHDDHDPLQALSLRIREVAETYRTTFLSVSATLRFPAPYPVRHMLELDEKWQLLKGDWERHEAKQILVGERKDLIHRIESAAVSPKIGAIDLPKTPTPGDAAALKNLDEQLGYFDQLPPPVSALPSSFLSEKTISSFMKAAAADQPVNVKQPSEIALQSALETARFDIEEYRKMWFWYINRNADDFRLDQYQKITMLKSIVPITSMDLCKSCGPPKLDTYHFYGQDDVTLGQYIERAVNSINDRCTEKTCEKPMLGHGTIYVHNESRVVITIEQMNDRDTWKGPAAAILEQPDRMITWSYCQSCKLSTPFIPLTEESWRYSFAKYLELFFYPAEVVPLSGIACFHNVYQHHVRYFWWRHVAVRFQATPVTLSEAVFPPLNTRIRPETLVELKNADYASILDKQSAFWDSVVRRIHTISLTELQCQGQEKLEKMAKLQSLTPELLVQAEADRHEVLAMTRKVYDKSAMTDTMAFSEVRTCLQAKVLQWDQKFAEYERNFIATERDIIRRATASQLRRLFANQDLGTDRLPQVSVVELDEKGSIASSGLVSPMPSDITETMPSDVSESDTNSVTSADPLPTASDGSMTSSSRNSAETPTPALTAFSQASFDAAEATPTPQTVEIAPESQRASPSTSEDQSDHDSDSTIEAPTNTLRPSNSISVAHMETKTEDSVVQKEQSQFVSRLPRRMKLNPKMADLVKRFQEAEEPVPDSVPPSAYIKPNDEGDTSDAPRGRGADPRAKLRRKNRAKVNKPKKRDSGLTSDFERSYAANVGPRYLESGTGSKIPGPSRPTFLRQASGSFRANPPAALSLGGRPTTSKGKTPLRAHERSLSNKPSMSSLNAFRAGARRVTGPLSNKVSSLTKQYERLAKDADRAARRVSNLRFRRARPLATTQAKIQVFDNVKDAIRDESDSESSDSEADDEDDGEEDATAAPSEVGPMPVPVIQTQAASPKKVATPFASTVLPAENPIICAMNASVQDIPPSPGPSQTSSPTSPEPAPSITQSVSTQISEADLVSSAEKHPSLLKTINAAMGLWPGSRPGDWPPLDYPSSSLEHIFADSTIIIREDEPTSIISFALSTKDYQEQIKLSQKAKLPAKFDGYVPEEAHHIPDHDTSWGMINPEDLIPNVEDVLKQQTAIHSNQIFESGATSIFCRVFFAEQFDALRRSCGCETSFVESLARCLKWDATGGKSGSAFLKTRDDRFIAKELSRPELTAMTKFAPKYFEYMSNVFSMKKPSVLAKVFGFYKVGYKNPNTGKIMRLNLLVMENVFYERRFSKIYDLKGSMRNRLIQSTGKLNEVLLDENLVQSAHLTPWYIREHTKCMLRAALWNDTTFLCDLNVMDYSLLVGVDRDRNELVVGIVDYIRTYTWDKKLESWVKESTFLGGAKGEPTIVTPRQYKTRFLSAMERYLMMVPDRWMKREDQPDPNGNEDIDGKQDAS
ncbi:hypothetical protein DACRYDRAFT_117647 [Dacryopinax primogenitus]|uniref:1-phosphatidylinositol-3-phosphate 5-kinase n=1 Tax=Dacryopinax primogenitus (strain DJM 731) TaxID=1858805 RepID=M5FRZ8_DACPD|nr:uncharacterized protein DACRYDRAFT_117647 [Dacryopinax primogenitus]EJU00051.1 hypothetical protein DACRYDRAFT_117647 [Dacryopinax primogenitus]